MADDFCGERVVVESLDEFASSTRGNIRGIDDLHVVGWSLSVLDLSADNVTGFDHLHFNQSLS